VRQQQNDLEEPLELLRRAIRVQPGNPSLHNSLGQVHLRRNELTEAELSFHEAAGIDPNFTAAQNGIAVVEISRGRFPAAEHALRKALKSEPENTQVLINLGIALLEQQNAGDAIVHLQQVVSREPENMTAQLFLGRAFLAAGNSGFAIKSFENVLVQRPDNAEVLLALGSACYQSRQYADAIKTYRRLLQLGQESAETTAGLARSHAALGNDIEATGLFIRALRLANNEESLLLDFADLQLKQGNYADVINRLEAHRAQAAAQTRNPVRMTRLLAEAKLNSGDAAAAMDLLQSLSDTGQAQPVERLLLVRALHANGAKAEADALLQALLEEDPQPVDAVLYSVEKLRGPGDHAMAIQSLRSIQRRHDLSHQQRQRAVALLGDALHHAGNYQAAWEHYLGLDQKTAEVITIRSEQSFHLVANEAADTAMEREVAWSWPPQPPDDGRPEPVFVFAWPGAGRAELLAALKGHSGICVVNDRMDEQTKRREVICHPQGRGPLGSLTSAEIRLARRKYWKALGLIDSRAPNAAVTLDAMWLTAESLPSLYRYFPQAHVIVLEQDPKDLAVGWFQAAYRDLDAMAALYKQQMALLNRCRAGVPLHYISVDASRFEQEAGSVLREVVSALSIAWEPAIDAAWKTGTMTRDLATPGKWVHYETWLQPTFAVLEG
jgi:tetratricopeptide (TPR) repeat protein